MSQRIETRIAPCTTLAPEEVVGKPVMDSFGPTGKRIGTVSNAYTQDGWIVGVYDIDDGEYADLILSHPSSRHAPSIVAPAAGLPDRAYSVITGSPRRKTRPSSTHHDH